MADRLPRIAPFLRYDKDPYLVVDDRGHLVYVQDAYTISDKFPHATWFDTGRSWATESGLVGDAVNYIRNSVKITMDAYDGTMRFYVADPTDPIIRAWQGIFPALFLPMDQMAGGAPGPPAGARGAVQRPDPGLRPVPRRQPADVLQPDRPVDGAREADEPAEPRVRGVLRRDADARRAEGGVPAAAADDRGATGRT